MQHYNVLFLCTGNSSRSIMAEAILNHKGTPTFTAYSAGSQPAGMVRPEALERLRSAGMNTTGLRSKSWDEFTGTGAPHFDFIFTVCDNAAQEACPLWPNHPVTAHWGIPDPAAVHGSPGAIERAYQHAFAALCNRIFLMLALPLASMDRLAIQCELESIGKQ